MLVWIPDSLAEQGFRDDRRECAAVAHLDTITVKKSLAWSLVARIERSAMRDRLRRAVPAVPDFAPLLPGYGLEAP